MLFFVLHPILSDHNLTGLRRIPGTDTMRRTAISSCCPYYYNICKKKARIGNLLLVNQATVLRPADEGGNRPHRSSSAGSRLPMTSPATITTNQSFKEKVPFTRTEVEVAQPGKA